MSGVNNNAFENEIVISLQTQLSNHKRVEERLRKIYGSTEAKNTLSKAELHKRRGRKFTFLNLGPLGCIPGIRILLNPSSDSGGCVEAASLRAKLHNQALTKSLKRLAKQLHGFKYSLYDFHTNLNQRLKHPSKYGCLSSQNHFNEHVALFVFGDSLYDPGNNNYINTTADFQANFWPYGVSYFSPPSGRFSDGRLIADFIAEFAGLPLIPAYLDPQHNEFVHGANFASGGAGALVETHAGFVCVGVRVGS
ncbi:GDSL esterase/lipase 1-like protein [Tanacetum coccineum]